MKTNNRKKYIILFIVMFIFFFMLNFVLTMLTGVDGRPQPGEIYHSLTFKETFDKIHSFIFFALFCSIIFIYLLKEIDKKREKDARKRIAKREKKEKEEQAKEQRNANNLMKR